MIMSDLQKAFAKSHLAKLPPEPLLIFDEEDEDIGELSLGSPTDSPSSASSTGTIVPSPRKKLFEIPKQFVDLQS